MFGTAGQGESDDQSAGLLWNDYIALGTKVRKCVLIPNPIFAFMAQGLIWGHSCCTKDADLKVKQFLSRFTTIFIDRRRSRDLQSIVGIRPS